MKKLFLTATLTFLLGASIVSSALGCTATITQTGPATFCSGTTPLTLKANTGASYQWYLNGVAIVTATGKQYKPATSGTYSVTVTNSSGCSATSGGITVTVLTSPASVVETSGPASFLCKEPGVTLYNKGEGGNAMYFDGVDDYVSFATMPAYNPAATSIEAWISPKSWSSANSEIAGWTDNASHSIEFRVAYGKLEFGIWDGTTWQAVTSNSHIDTLSTGIWTHVAAVKNGTTVKLYINGVLNKTGTVTNSITPATFNLGTSDLAWTVYLFSGYMDEVRIWNTVRSAAQLSANKNKTLAGTTSGLTAYYKFDEGTGTKIVDATTNTFKGTLINGPAWQIPSAAPIGTVNSSYLWNTGATTQNIHTYLTGSYTLTVTAPNGCVKKSAVKTFASVIAVNIVTDQCAPPGGGGQWEAMFAGGTGPWIFNSIKSCCPPVQTTYTSPQCCILGSAAAGETWTISVTDSFGCQSPSFTKTMCLAFKSGLAGNADETKQVSAYPNPFTNQLNMDVITDEDLSIVVRDVSGRIVESYKGINGSFIINSKWDAGIYSVTIQNESGTYNKILKVVHSY